MGRATSSSVWDEVWAEFDARQPARPSPARVAPAPARPVAGFRPLIALICVLLATLYLLSPVASALQLAGAIRRGDAQTLARQIDWEALRPALAATLSARIREPMPAFVTGMARDMAARLSEPEALTELLNARLSQGAPAREMLGRVRILGIRLWEIELSSPRTAARVTLALADPWRLRWEVRALALPSLAP